MSDMDDKQVEPSSATRKGSKRAISRRELIRSGATAMPAILTLHSGAALARSSNTISASSPNTTDSLGRTLCVEKRSVVPAHDGRGGYDLGDPPYAKVNIIRGPHERQYFVKDWRGRRTPIHPGAMCERGGKFYWQQRGGHWRQVKIRKGFVVSSGAMVSIADHVKDNLI